MTYDLIHVRPGLTAIAAILALSATPVVAQDVAAPVDIAAEQEAAAEAPAADPLAPDQVAEAIAVEPDVDVTESESAAAPAAKPAKKVAAKAPVKPSAEATSAPTPAAAAPEAVADVPTLPVAELSAPLEQDLAAAEPVEAKASVDDALVPAAGAGAGLILALAGAGMAVRRRRRRNGEEEVLTGWMDDLDDEAAVAEPQPDPVPARGAPPALASGPQRLPNGFDLSKFGPHVQAAYRGPSAGNPSHSLKRRLARVRALDQRDRLHAS